MDQPEPIGVDHVGLAVCRDLVDEALLHELVNLRAVDPTGLSLKSESAADLMERRLAPAAEESDHVAQIHGVGAVAVEVGSRREANRGTAYLFNRPTPGSMQNAKLVI